MNFGGQEVQIFLQNGATKNLSRNDVQKTLQKF